MTPTDPEAPQGPPRPPPPPLPAPLARERAVSTKLLTAMVSTGAWTGPAPDQLGAVDPWATHHLTSAEVTLEDPPVVTARLELSQRGGGRVPATLTCPAEHYLALPTAAEMLAILSDEAGSLTDTMAAPIDEKFPPMPIMPPVVPDGGA